MKVAGQCFILKKKRLSRFYRAYPEGMLSNRQRGLLKIEPSWCYDWGDCSAREINPGQECLCSRAKKGRMEEEIKGCERANECMGTERG